MPVEADDKQTNNNSMDNMVKSRPKRLNAGNKLQKLLEQEKLADSSKSSTIRQYLNNNQEDHDVLDLLFQDDDEEQKEDIDFVMGDYIQKDDVFTDSDNEDDDKGDTREEDTNERQLEQERKRERRLERKAKNKIPVLTKRKTVDTNDKNIVQDTETQKQQQRRTKRRRLELQSAETLLSQTRRTSSRKSAIANKIRVYEKLLEEEKQRNLLQEKYKKIALAKKERYKELTQEEKLQEALKTESINRASLNKYKEMELHNKKNRLMMQQRGKIKFKAGEEILTMYSCEWRVTPVMEVEDLEYWKAELKKRENGGRKRRPRRKKPLKKQLKEKGKEEEEGQEKQLNVNKDGGEQQLLNKSDVILQKPVINEGKENKNGDINFMDETEVKQVTVARNVSENNCKHRELDRENMETLQKNIIIQEQESFIQKELSEDHNTLHSLPKTEGKSFTENPNPITKELNGDVNDVYEESPYQGPEQQVSKNFIWLHTFLPQPTNQETTDIKAFLFGQPVKPASAIKEALEDDLETIIHSKKPTDQDKPKIRQISIKDVETILGNFPRFGEYDKKIKHSDVVQHHNTETIELKTKPPSGLFLPNGQRKKCLFSGKNAQYFDPKYGIPYSDLESYRMLQEMIDSPCKMQWFEFKNGGILLNSSIKPAKGCPEGF
ncbi:Vps72p SCDLUD_002573 [Saccharomycodes ludwigii]|uniref:Vps72p n=1 Tax=Saccharomycodes ludwigii TaxID=36035 RepID=UPI001E865B74|nr:hypothetical protein SCDLUD_002573 [Saccharomycodes ludwigii]KAH3901097.1 hypothetical protein SCDLUD_002573 [Saccharomycodes ludwigii]